MIESTLKSTGLIPLCARNCTIDIKTGVREERIEVRQLAYQVPDSIEERRPFALERGLHNRTDSNRHYFHGD